MKLHRYEIPFWTNTKSPQEKKAAVALYAAYNRALNQGRHADARAIQAEMTPTKIKET